MNFSAMLASTPSFVEVLDAVPFFALGESTSGPLDENNCKKAFLVSLTSMSSRFEFSVVRLFPTDTILV